MKLKVTKMASKKMRRDGHLCRGGKRLLEELERETDAELDQLNFTVPDLINIPFPDLGIDDSSYAAEAASLQEQQQRTDANEVNDGLGGDGCTNPVMGENHEDTDRDSDDDDITAGREGVYSFVESLPFNEALRYWAILGRLPRSTLNMLLAILRKNFGLDIPKDARAFLKTPTRTGLEVQTISGGELWYLGIEKALHNYFRNVIPEVGTFSLQVSIDGLPLFKSSKRQLWPILIKVEELPKAPVMLVGVFCGHTKPELIEEFLRPLVLEVNDLQQRGLEFGEKRVRLVLRALIADSPARAFAKATVSFSGRHGCLKCSCVGEYIQSGSKMIFDSVHAELRTDAGFRGKVDIDHHKEWRTPLEDIEGFDMIRGVPVGDRTHLIDWGVTKNILLGLLKHVFPNFYRWSPQQKVNASNFIISVLLPAEVNRPMRSFENIRFWKATEFRSFLHYISVAVLKDFYSTEAFNHFLYYYCGVTILSTLEHQRYWPLAEKFLEKFVEDFGKYYGRSHLTSNVHNLIHVFGDVMYLGPLDNFSAYPFENYLQIVKRYVRSGTRVAEQVVARMQELASIEVAANQSALNYPRLKTNGAGIHIAADFVILPNFRDQWFLTKDHGIVKFLEAKKVSPFLYTIIGIQYDSWREQFRVSLGDLSGGEPEIRISSSDLHIYKIDESSPSRTVEIPCYMVKCKFVAYYLPSQSLAVPPIIPPIHSDTIALFPLLHTFQID